MGFGDDGKVSTVWVNFGVLRKTAPVGRGARRRRTRIGCGIVAGVVGRVPGDVRKM